MNIKDKIKLLLKEADLYKSQRLLPESKGKYLSAIELIQNSKKIQNSDNLINAIKKKIQTLDTGIVKWSKSDTTPEVSTKVQDLIKNLFSGESQEDSDAVKALKSAITLAKFGQFKKAIEDFNRLIPLAEVSVAAAKNSIKCIIEISSVEEAVSQYKKWMKNDVFPGEKGGLVKKFLLGIIEKKGLNISIDSTDTLDHNEASSDILSEISSMADDDDGDIIDITSVGIRFTHGPKSGEQCELDVSFQAGNMLSLIVSNKDQMLVDCLKVGVNLEDMDFYSPIAIFKGSGVVESNTRIGSGPEKR